MVAGSRGWRSAGGDGVSETDFELASAMYQAMCAGGDVEEMLFVVLPGPPASKARPRFARGRVYSSGDSAKAEALTAARLRQALPQGPFPGNVALGCVFFRPNSQRIDTDNLLKHVCDAANGVLWVDDSQVTALMGRTELDQDNPRTVVVVGRHISSLKRGSDATTPCSVCEKPVQIVSGRSNKTCSKECSMRLRGYSSLAEPVPCAHCGEQFRRRTKTQKLCSPECRAASMASRNRQTAKPCSKCADCGVQLAHHRGGRCRECWRTSQPREAS